MISALQGGDMKLVLSFGLAALMTTAVSAQIVVNPTSLNLGTVDRGSGAASNIKVTNTFPAQTTFTVSFLTQSGHFSVGPSSLNLAPNAQGTIFVNIEAGSSTGSYSGTFTIQGGGATVTVPVSATVIDQFGTTLSPTLLDLGTVIVGQTSDPKAIFITNTSPGTLSYSGTANPSLYSVSPAVSIPSGQSGALNVTFAPGTNVGNFPGTVSVKANNTIVGTLNLKAISAVPPGSIQVAPAILDFGTVDRTAGASSNYTLTNGSTATLNFNFQRTGNFVTSTSQVSLAGGQSKTISVNVEAGAGPGTLNGAITITGGGQSASVTLKANVVEPNPPDLTISFLSTTPTLTTTRVGQVATFSLRIQTGGTSIATGIAVKMFLDNVLVKTATVSPSQFSNLSLGFPIPANTTGSHTVRVDVDANNQITESNETNNSATANVTF